MLPPVRIVANHPYGQTSTQTVLSALGMFFDECADVRPDDVTEGVELL